MVKIIILAAGEGKRLRPHTLDKPKCMVKIQDLALIECQLAVINSCKIEDVTIVGGYKFELLENLKVNKIFNPQFAGTNMVNTLLCAKDQLEGEVIISYGDIVYSKDILLKAMEFKGSIGVVADVNWRAYWEARSSDPLSDAESFKVNSVGNIIDIGNRVASVESIPAQYIGLTKLSPDGIKIFETTFQKCRNRGSINGKRVESAYMTDLIQEIIFSGHKVSPIFINSDWIEVDTTDDLNNPISKSRITSIMNDL